jgi:Bacterial transcriptional activator domain
MPTRRDELYAAHGAEPYDNALARAQARLAETLTELSRLTQEPIFDRVDSVVADLVNAPASPHLDVDTVHKLRDLSAEHERVAIELEAAARCCRLVEREINQRIDTLLAGGDGELAAKSRPNPEAQRAITRRRIGPDGWLTRLFHRGRPGTWRSRESPIPVVREHEHSPHTLLTQSMAPYPETTAIIPAADIAALALGPLEVHVAGRPEKVMDSYHKAIQLYRGPLFEDDGVSEWYLPEQRRLKDLYEQALQHVAEIHFQLGELPEALQFGQLAISNDPCCEAIHRLLMRCYASQHQQQLVSRQYPMPCRSAVSDAGAADGCW